MSAYQRMSDDEETRGGSSDVPDGSQPAKPVIVQSGVPSQPVQINPAPRSNILQDYRNKVALICGIIQVVLGSLYVVLGIVAIVVRTIISSVGIGFWGGAIFIIAGGFGIASSTKKTRCTIITCMVLSIIASVLAGVFVLTMANMTVHIVFFPYYAISRERRIYSAVVIVGSLVISFIELIVSIVQSAMCCRVTCCGAPAPQEVRVMYVPYTPGQQIPGQDGNVTFLDSSVQNTSGNQPMVIIAPQGDQTVPQVL